MRHFKKKYTDCINTKYAAGYMWKSLSYIFYGVSLVGVSCRRLGQLRLYSCPDNAIGLVSAGSWRQFGGVLLITTNVYVDQTLCTILIN